MHAHQMKKKLKFYHRQRYFTIFTIQHFHIFIIKLIFCNFYQFVKFKVTRCHRKKIKLNERSQLFCEIILTRRCHF